ncbi:helix-turn-helix domain-containing protein [Clostridium perfringens]
MFSLKEVCDKYNLSYGSLKWGCSTGKYTDAQQIMERGKAKWYISQKDLDEILEDVSFINKSYSISELQKLLDCSRSYINRLVENNVFSNFKHINNKLYVLKEEVNDYLQKKSFNRDLYYTVQEVSDISGLEKGHIHSYVEKNRFSDTIKHKNTMYISKSDTEALMNILVNYYKSSEIASIMNLNNPTICVKCKKGHFAGAIKNPFAPSSWIVPKKTIDTIISNYVDEHNMNLSEQELFYAHTKNLDTTNIQITYKLYNQFINSYIKTSNADSIDKLVRSLILAYKQLYNYLDKELHLHSNSEVDLLFKNNAFTIEGEKYITLFINYTKKMMGDKCLYTKKYAYSKPSNEDASYSDRVYSKKLWGEYYSHLTNIDAHIEKAISDKKYSATWLYLIMHLFVAWRRKDFLKLPNIDVTSIGINNFAWFKDNTFTLSMGETIINQLRLQCQGIYANKNKAQTHFIVTMDAILPLSICYSIAELHRKENGFSSVLEVFSKTPPKKERHIKKVFELKPDLQEFSSLKCNRTLITYGYENAVKSTGTAYLAYDLATHLRSHIKNKHSGVSDMTQKYIYSSNSDGSVEDVIFNLFRRGFWGWLYKDIAIIYALKKAEDTVSLEKETALIEAMQETYSAIELDSIAGYLNEQLNSRNDVVKELLLLDKNELRNTLDKLISKKMPAKMKNAQCLKSYGCEHTSSSTCYGCKYLIPEQYLLYSINDELKSLIKALSKTPNHLENERIKLTYFIRRMLMLLQDAKTEYDKYDSDYISTIFDLKNILKDIKKLESSKFLFMED